MPGIPESPTCQGRPHHPQVRPDVVHYRQNVFLPAMAEFRARLVEYRKIGDDAFEEILKQGCGNWYCVHMTSQPCKRMMERRQDGVRKMSSHY